MIILISNDDGINSDGISCLEKSLKNLGQLWTVAPDRPQSAMSRALTLSMPLKATRLSDNRFMVNGTPSDCVNIAINKLMPVKPDIMISGINCGANLCDDISYSGTVAAAFEATILGIPAVAVSLASRKNCDFKPAAEFIKNIIPKVISNGLPENTFLNINIPDTKGNRIIGAKITHQGKSLYENIITERTDPRGEKYFWIGGDGTSYADIAGSDADAIKNNYASITPINTDLTDYSALEVLKKWGI
jgi:5'-nucleotidase